MGTERPLALITGASSGIGAAFARQLAARGFDLVMVARRAARIEALAAELEKTAGIRAEALAADLTEEAGLRRVEERIAAAPDLELLVNNAGFGTKGYFHQADAAVQEQMHRLHVLATLRLTRAALPGLLRRRKGGIIQVSSVAAFTAAPGNVSYCSTKAWMNAFTEGLYCELKQLGSPVKVQALCPGFTRSEFHDVAGMDRAAVPKSWWMDAGDVVARSLRGLDRGERIVIPGWRYKLIVWIAKTVPRTLFLNAAARFYKRA